MKVNLFELLTMRCAVADAVQILVDRSNGFSVIPAFDQLLFECVQYD